MAINLSIGNKGIFNKVQYGRQEYLNSKREEKTQLAKMTNDLDEYIDGQRKDSTVNPILKYSGSVQTNEKNPTVTFDTDKNKNYIICIAMYRDCIGTINTNSITVTGCSVIHETDLIQSNPRTATVIGINSYFGIASKSFIVKSTENKITVNTSISAGNSSNWHTDMVYYCYEI